LATRQVSRALAGTAGAASLAYWGPGLSASVPFLRRPLGIRDRLADSDAVGLTFDDGPHPHGTPAVLGLLRDAGARATFFVVGEQVERRPLAVGEIVAAGHDVALHCHRHRNLLRLTPGQVRDDLDRAAAVIADAAGRAPRLWRPPYGVFTAAALAIARKRGWEPVLWTRWGRDWEGRATAESVAAKVSDGVRGGDILLLHDADYYSAPDSWRRTVAALPRVLEAVGRMGLRVRAA
jgi:peptidoglycan/xylan/chitin deacetylase (PgdA/CDA1 family)